MSVITTENYKLLVVDYTAALTQIANVADHYYAAAEKVLALDIFDPELDLLNPFYNAYLTATVAFAAQPQSVVNAVKALQAHIISKGGYASVDAYYLADGNFSHYFTAEFANLSQQAGYSIGVDYIVE